MSYSAIDDDSMRRFRGIYIGLIYAISSDFDKPDNIIESPYMAFAIRFLENVDSSNLLLSATLLFSLSIFSSFSLRLLNLWMIGRLAANIGVDLSRKVISCALNKPYGEFIAVNSSETIASSTVLVSQTVIVVNAIFQFLTGLVIVSVMVLSFILVDWKIALLCVSFVFSLYILVTIYTRPRLSYNSSLISRSTKSQLKLLQESLKSIRDLILDNNQQAILASLANTTKKFVLSRQKITTSHLFHVS